MAGSSSMPTWLERLLLVVLSPLVFLLLTEGAIRVVGVETELARNESAQIAVPVWLLADDAWVDAQRSRMAGNQGAIRAEDIAWYYHFEEARYIQYKMKPNVDVEAVNPFNPVEVEKGVTFRLRSNGSGFRTAPLEPKPDGVTRIVTIGDSSTFGWGTDAEETFQRVLEGRLQEELGGRFQVYNLGIPGHNSRHGLGMLEHWALPLNPDLVVVSYGANDPRRTPVPTDEILDAHEGWRGALRFTLLELESYRLLRRGLLSVADPLRGSGGRERQLVPAVSNVDYHRNLRSLAADARTAGAEVVFLSVCAPDTHAAAMRQVAAGLHVPFVDARVAFESRLRRLRAGKLYPHLVDRYRDLYGQEVLDAVRGYYVTNDGCHPNAVGHRILADEMFPLVRDWSQTGEIPLFSRR